MRPTKFMNVGAKRDYILFLVVFMTSLSWCAPPQEVSQRLPIHIGQVEEKDFEAVKKIGLAGLMRAYNLTQPEQIQALKNAYEFTIDEDRKQMLADGGIIGLVATYDDAVVGYFSASRTNRPDQVYGRTLMVDPVFQRQGISSKLIKRCKQLFGEVATAVCLTSKRNYPAQKFYEYLGGKRIEDPEFIKYLYSNLDPQNFADYEFNLSSLKKFYAHE